MKMRILFFGYQCSKLRKKVIEELYPIQYLTYSPYKKMLIIHICGIDRNQQENIYGIDRKDFGRHEGGDKKIDTQYEKNRNSGL